MTDHQMVRKTFETGAGLWQCKECTYSFVEHFVNGQGRIILRKGMSDEVTHRGVAIIEEGISLSIASEIVMVEGDGGVLSEVWDETLSNLFEDDDET